MSSTLKFERQLSAQRRRPRGGRRLELLPQRPGLGALRALLQVGPGWCPAGVLPIIDLCRELDQILHVHALQQNPVVKARRPSTASTRAAGSGRRPGPLGAEASAFGSRTRTRSPGCTTRSRRSRFVSSACRRPARPVWRRRSARTFRYCAKSRRASSEMGSAAAGSSGCSSRAMGTRYRPLPVDAPRRQARVEPR